MSPAPRRLRVAVLSTLAFAIALGIACCLVWLVTPFAGPDAPGWLPAAMIVAATAGLLAVLLRLSIATPPLAGIALPTLGACVGFLLVGGVLLGVGSGDPLRGPLFALSQFRFLGIYLVGALGIAASAAFRMGTSPHRDRRGRPVG